jgi:hypothetical protein
MTENTKVKCPSCGGKNIIPILYGWLSVEGFKKVERGEAEWGGCLLDEPKPHWFCKVCGWKGNGKKFLK